MELIHTRVSAILATWVPYAVSRSMNATAIPASIKGAASIWWMATSATVCWARQVHKAQVEGLDSNRIEAFNYFLCVVRCVPSLHTEISLCCESIIFTLLFLAEFWCVCVDCLTLTGTSAHLGRIYFLFNPNIQTYSKKIRYSVQNSLFFCLNSQYNFRVTRWHFLVSQCFCIMTCLSCTNAHITLKQVAFLIWLFLENSFVVLLVRFGFLICLTSFSRSELWK